MCLLACRVVQLSMPCVVILPVLCARCPCMFMCVCYTCVTAVRVQLLMYANVCAHMCNRMHALGLFARCPGMFVCMCVRLCLSRTCVQVFVCVSTHGIHVRCARSLCTRPCMFLCWSSAGATRNGCCTHGFACNVVLCAIE
jgi:hypothetical protein